MCELQMETGFKLIVKIGTRGLTKNCSGFPVADEAWRIIWGRMVGVPRARHEDCRRGFDEFEWMREIREYICFFYLTADEFYREDDEFDEFNDWLICTLKCIHVSMIEAKLEAESETDGDNPDEG